MKRRVTNALLAACVISGGCTYLLGRKIKFVSAQTDRHRLRYVAPSHALEPGAVLRAEDLEWTDWPADKPLAGALTRQETAGGRVALFRLAPGDPILERDLAEPGTGGGLESRIPKGMRAVALRCDDIVGVAGFLAPDSRVDVLVTYRTGSATESVTATVLQNAQVLATGQRVAPDPTNKPESATVVTLLLTPGEAEQAVLASTQGTIHFVLRNALDKDQTLHAPISLAQLGGGAQGQAGGQAGGQAWGPASLQIGGPAAGGRLTRPEALAASARARGGVHGAGRGGVETILGGESAAGESGGKQP